MNLGSLVDRIVKKHWTAEEIHKYVGNYRGAALTHAADEAVRQYAASGGTTSALLIAGLHSGEIDGAIVCKTVMENGRVRAHFSMATTREEILAAQGSKYIETSFLREVIPLIRAFNGRVAVVGLPCNITAILRRSYMDPELKGKIVLTMALFCGHNSRKELIDRVTQKIEKNAGSRLVGYRFRIGHWRGHIEAKYADGTTKTYPTGIFNDYQNLFFFSERKCLACNDHYGYKADISVGDVWLFRLKHDPIKRSGVIVRSDAGERFFEHAVQSGNVTAEPLDIRDILDGQSRIGPSHYNLSARVKAGKWFGFNLKDTVKERVRLHQWLNAYLSIMNMRLSESAYGSRLIFMFPRPFIRFYLYIKKGLETLK
jgi:coenzyme F420 hydrogenase subunit beta